MKRYLLSLSVLSLLAVACTLDEPVTSQSMEENYYQTVQQCRTGLNACYTNIRNIFVNRAYFSITDVTTDVMFTTQTYNTNAILQVSTASPQFGTTMWNHSYQGIMRANAMMDAIDRAPLTDSQKAPLLAEAVVLRALFYYVLTNNFGDVPFYEEKVTEANNTRIAQLPRMDRRMIRRTMMDELEYWILEREALDLVRTNDPSNSQAYRCGAALGLMLGGKMALWNEDWARAVRFFEKLEDIYGFGAGNPDGSLEQYPLSDIPFGKSKTSEVIFEIYNTSAPYSIQVSGTLAGICTPYRGTTLSDDADVDEVDLDELLSESDYYDGVGIPELGGDAKTSQPLRPTSHFYKDLMSLNSGDRRGVSYNPLTGEYLPGRGGYLAYGWEGYLAGEDRSETEPSFHLFNSCVPTGTDPAGVPTRAYLGEKFWCMGMHYTMDVNTYKVFRYAGALMGLAEAWFQLGDADKCCLYMNQIKRRAGIPEKQPTDFASEDDLMKEIQDENAREFFGEFQRKHDLVRWGIWYDSVLKYNAVGNENLRKNIKPCHEYYPIAADQITYSGGALDNREYNKYGL